MKNPARRIVIGLIFALVVGFIAWIALRDRPGLPAAVPVVSPTGSVREEAAVPADEYRPPMRAGPVPSVSVFSEPTSGEAPLEHMLRSVIAANAEELMLTPEETDRLVAETLEFHEVHAELVKRFLEEKSFDPVSVTLHVPPFPVEGKALRELYHRRLESALPGKLDAIKEHIGHFIDGSFRGFGIAEQTFVLTRSTTHPNSIELTWEARVPEGQTAGGLNEGMSYPGGASTMLLTPEQIAFGEYRFLGPVLASRFPEISLKQE